MFMFLLKKLYFHVVINYVNVNPGNVFKLGSLYSGCIVILCWLLTQLAFYVKTLAKAEISICFSSKKTQENRKNDVVGPSGFGKPRFS